MTLLSKYFLFFIPPLLFLHGCETTESQTSSKLERFESDEYKINQTYISCISKQPEFFNGIKVLEPKLQWRIELTGNPEAVLNRCTENPVFKPIYVNYSYKQLWETQQRASHILKARGIKYRAFIKAPAVEDSLPIKGKHNNVNIVVLEENFKETQSLLSKDLGKSISVHKISYFEPREVFAYE